jgi:hypothetical protein
MKNYIHVKIFILWTLVISTLANEWTKILSPSPNLAQMCSLFLMDRANKCFLPNEVPIIEQTYNKFQILTNMYVKHLN